MLVAEIPQHLVLIHLVISLYTCIVESWIRSFLGSPRVKLLHWSQSLWINAKIVPISGILSVIFGLIAFFNIYNYLFLYASLLVLFAPLFMSLVGKVPINNQNFVRINKKYEAYEELTQAQGKDATNWMKKWMFFHLMRCVIVFVAWVMFIMAKSQVNNAVVLTAVVPTPLFNETIHL